MLGRGEGEGCVCGGWLSPNLEMCSVVWSAWCVGEGRGEGVRGRVCVCVVSSYYHLT